MNEQYNRRQEDVDMAEVKSDVKYLVKEVDKINDKLEKEYVTQDQFEPIKKIVYGVVGIMLVGVITALMTLVLRNKV